MYVIATNTKDASLTNDAINFPYYGEMWVKFSEALDPDLNKIAWDTVVGGASLYGNPNSDNYNSVARISGDTLFVKPNPALVNIPYGSVVGFQVNVTTLSGRTSGYKEFKVSYMESDLFVKWTNTKNIDGSIKETFGLLDTIILVSSKQLTAITNVSVGDLGGGLPPDITLDNISLSASGDTIRYIPTVRMAVNTQYSIDFNVKRTDGITTGTSDVLDVTWKTIEGVRIVSVNNRMGGNFRPFKVIGDSLVVEFSTAIDITKTFKVNNFVAKYTVAWSADRKVATIKNTDTLTAGGFAALPYTDNAATMKYDNLNFTLTTVDGQTQADLAPTGKNLDIHVEQGLWVVSASYIEKTDAASPVSPANGKAIDTIAKDANLTVVFSRALDTNAIKADAVNLYQKILTLHKHNAAVLLDFTLTFSTDAKTMTINPKQDLENGVQYAVSFINVPAAGLGSKNSFAGTGDADKSLITGYDFEVAVLPIVNISAKQCSLIVDTNTTPDRRKGYSPAAASYTGDVADSTMIVKIRQVAWNAGHQDSVTHYQFRYRKQGAESWYIDENLQADINYSTFHSPAMLANNEWVASSVVIDNKYRNTSYMLTADKDGAGSDYTNGDHWLNGGTVVELQARAVFDSDDDGNLATGSQSYGAWSSSVIFKDDIAPGDTTFGIAGVTKADDENMDGTTGDAINWDNFKAAKDTVGIVVTFPEDMDVTFATTPSITFYNALGNQETPPAKLAAPLSRWISGRRYLIAVELAAGTNFNDEVEFSEMAEGSITDNWTVGGSNNFIFSSFAGTGPNAAPINAGIYNGLKVLGTELTTSNGTYVEGADMSGAAYDINGANENAGSYIITSKNINLEDYGNILLEFRMVSDLGIGDKVELEIDSDGDGDFDATLKTYTNAQNQYTNWKQESIDLTPFKNINNVKIRFRMRCNNDGNVGTGFFVDNLRIRYVNSDSWYYSINVAGMKDGSGVVCQNSGSTGNAANDRAMTAVTDAVTGNRNVGGLKLCQ